jgi:SOS-response transcriptional repressor LexA
MSIGIKVKELLKDKKISQKKLAKELGESEINISRWLKDDENDVNFRRIPFDVLIKIAEKLNVTTDYILDSDNTIPTTFVPLIGKSSCGKPKEYDLNGFEPISIPADMYKSGMYALEADGDSMSPKINDGDIVYCCPNQQIDNGNIVHYWLGGESGIKKYKINEQGTQITLLPLNTDYDVISINWSENVDLMMAKVVGRIDRDF